MNLNLEIKWSRVLGFYLLTIAIMQSFVYFQMLANNEMDFFYFDPRIGIFAYLEILNIEVLHMFNETDIIILLWLTAGWLAFLGTLFIIGRSPLVLYVVSEVLLSAPSIVFIIHVIIMNVRPATGFSIQELPYPILVLALTTFIPLAFIFFCARRHRREILRT